MTEEQIAVKLAEHQKEIGSLKYRVSDLEEQNNTIHDLTLSVKELAINMTNMLKEQERQAEHICMLEEKPVKNWETLITVVITSLTSGFIGYILSNLL